MGKPAALSKRTKPSKPKRNTAKRSRRKQRIFKPTHSLLSISDTVINNATLSVLTLSAIGYLNQQFSGTDLLRNILPFSLGIVLCILLCAWVIKAWSLLRVRLARTWQTLPLLTAVLIAGSTTMLIIHYEQWTGLSAFAQLIGGRQRVQTDNVAHQVYATYRRQDPQQQAILLNRSAPYQAVIREAAEAYQLNPQLLMGLASTESSYLPRTSQDGGQGLFQITAVARFIRQATAEKLHTRELDLNQPRHNAYLAAATLAHYLQQMKGDLYLGLLAYNIGPQNGGLRFIMDQYGAQDFVAMQPYLQTLPRDYPIRVLAQALAFKIWQQYGRLLPYQDEQNAVVIQHLGIPGLDQ